MRQNTSHPIVVCTEHLFIAVRVCVVSSHLHVRTPNSTRTFSSAEPKMVMSPMLTDGLWSAFGSSEAPHLIFVSEMSSVGEQTLEATRNIAQKALPRIMSLRATNILQHRPAAIYLSETYKACPCNEENRSTVVKLPGSSGRKRTRQQRGVQTLVECTPSPKIARRLSYLCTT